MQNNTTQRKDGHPSMRRMNILKHEPSDRAAEDSVFSKSLATVTDLLNALRLK
jgi:hypothetical protein